VRERIGAKLEKRLEDKGFLVLYWGDAGWVRFFSTKPIRGIDDLRKLKLFTWAGDAVEEELWKTNGFHVVPLASTDIVQQLQTHGIEAVPMTGLAAETYKIYTMAKNVTDVKWAPFLGATVISKATWEKIPAAQRVQLLAAARRSGDALKNDIRAQDDRAIDTMIKGEPGKRANALSLTALDPAAMAEWRRQTEMNYPKMKGKLAPADLFDEVQRLRDECRAAKAKAAPAKAAPGKAPAGKSK
jgi:TRAP-type transport system periplasmic protein